ncbi:threonine--tRNA ligase [Cellvibrio mixtus]|uniref:Threonine--tRNA ligase n=1 Tax=Cellvibrio mixtus TaxID=39650 RepID=A0A266Q9S1_9GAMM|nr:threonine--tRNA ligase [Cellvibrio mixtus]OZY86637.1 threonine--tRNA ligase [Cellvibrio mixtus]
MTMSESTIAITLPDGSVRHYPAPISALAVAQSIGAGLAKATVAARVNNTLVDASDKIHSDAQLQLITAKDANALPIIRHSCAHLLGHAVKQLFPSAKMVIGPVIDDGFYYDIAYERPFTTTDLEAVEARMQQLIAQDYDVRKVMTPRAQVQDIFSARGEEYKLKLIEDMPEVNAMGLYYHQEYIDMCRGPHVPNTRFLNHFKLTKISGAYWRGDANNEQLQRIYGTAWADKKQLQEHLTRLQEAEKRDHRKLCKELDLLHFQEEAPGSIFWHARGWTLFQQLINYMRKRQQAAGYIEVNTPDVMDRSLWEISGHWQNYRQNMFTTTTEDERVFALKPMNCPGGVSLFKHGLKSYRDLPIRMAEFGKVHRYEPSGSLHGLMRVRHFTQDDAHIFCTPEQMNQECKTIVELVLDIYKDFGFTDIAIKLSTRPANRMGSDAVWDLLEGALITSLDSMNLPYELNPGEGAFYGPKLEFVLRDAIRRDWQCGTLQVDMNLPERFDLTYVAEDGSRQRPVMLHRALFGSLERFTGILLEHYTGKLPAWLAPVQAVVLSITEQHADYAHKIQHYLIQQDIRTELDSRNEKIGYKIREHSLQRIPYLIVVGGDEMANGTAALRTQSGEDLGKFPVEQLAGYLKNATRMPIAEPITQWCDAQENCV